MNLKERSHEPELMDTVPVSQKEMKQVLSFLKVTNTFFGGNHVILKHLTTWSKNWPKEKTIHILDVGAGGADIPLAISTWAKKTNKQVHITAVDLVPDIIKIAQKNTHKNPDIEIQKKDVFDLPLNQTYDYVIASLFLHHIPPNQNTVLLKRLDKLATRGLIISDLLRSQASYMSINLLSKFIGNKIVRFDAPQSVRRAFTMEDLENLIKESGLLYLKANKEPWFRVSLAGEKA